MTTESLHQMMNALVQKPIAIPDWTARENPETERDVYLAMDPLLADLFKTWQTAKRQHSHLSSKNGPTDPMTEIAADMADSCQSAYQTRLIELQSQPGLQIQARRLVMKARLKAERERQSQSALYRANQLLFALERHRDEKRTRQRQKEEAFLFFIFWLFCFAFRQTRGQMWLAADFTRATGSGEKAAA